MLRRCSPVFVFTLLLGASSPALADDVPPEKPKQEKTEEKTEEKKGCSVGTPESHLAGLAALALLISVASLRRRR